MATNSKIEWCHHTFNPWIGCTKVSEACRFCYAEMLMDIRYGKVEWGPTGTRLIKKDWSDPVRWNKWAAEGTCYACGGKGMKTIGLCTCETCEGTGGLGGPYRARVFCASLADVFEDRPELVEPRTRLFKLIHATPELDWMLLTKRPENIKRLTLEAHDGAETFYENVWLGTSVEDQKTADARIPYLLDAPAAVHFISAEPLLGPIDLHPRPAGARHLCIRCGEGPEAPHDHPDGYRTRGLDLVIAGGESGHGARPMHPDWPLQLRDQCAAAGVAFHFKQWGDWAPIGPREATQCIVLRDGRSCDGTADEMKRLDREKPVIGGQWMYRVGKKAAGRVLDGRTHDDMPTPRQEPARS